MIKKSLALVATGLLITSCGSNDDAASGPITSTVIVDAEGNPVSTEIHTPEASAEGDEAADEPAFTYTRVDHEQFIGDGFFLADGVTTCSLSEDMVISCTRVVGEFDEEFGFKTEAPSVIWNPFSPNVEKFWDSGYPGYFAPGSGELNPGEFFETPGVSCWSDDEATVSCFGGVKGEGWRISHGEYEEFDDPTPYINSDQVLTSYVKFQLDDGASGYFFESNGRLMFGNLSGFNLGPAADVPNLDANGTSIDQEGNIRTMVGDLGQDQANNQVLNTGETKDYKGYMVTNTGSVIEITYPDGTTISLTNTGLET